MRNMFDPSFGRLTYVPSYRYSYNSSPVRQQVARTPLLASKVKKLRSQLQKFQRRSSEQRIIKDLSRLRLPSVLRPSPPSSVNKLVDCIERQHGLMHSMLNALSSAYNVQPRQRSFLREPTPMRSRQMDSYEDLLRPRRRSNQQTKRSVIAHFQHSPGRSRRRFRLRPVIYAVLFTVFIVSNFLDARARRFATASTKLRKSITINRELAQKWAWTVTFPVLLTWQNYSFGKHPGSLGTVQNLKEAALELLHRMESQDPFWVFSQFLTKLTRHDAAFPEEYLTAFEKTRLELDIFGMLMRPSLLQKQMLVAFFLVLRAIVRDVLLNFEEVAENQGIRSQYSLLKNCKAVASFLHFATLVAFADTSRTPSEAKEERGDIKLSASPQQRNQTPWSSLLFPYEHTWSAAIEEVGEKLLVWSSSFVRQIDQS